VLKDVLTDRASSTVVMTDLRVDVIPSVTNASFEESVEWVEILIELFTLTPMASCATWSHSDSAWSVIVLIDALTAKGLDFFVFKT
tara:strand:+ start:428 stop:685 length:258 start_codon:yes stop_codon:yes gene_type:complete